MSAADNASTYFDDGRTAGAGNLVDGMTTHAPTTAGDFRRWSDRHIRILVGYDALVGGTAAAVAVLFPAALHPHRVIDWLLLGLLSTVIWPLWVAFAQGYHRKHLGFGSGENWAVVRASVSLVVLSALPAAWFGFDGPLRSVAIGAPVAAVASIAVRYGWRRRLYSAQRSGGTLRRVIMVGSPESVQDLCDALDRSSSSGMQVAGVCVPAADIERARAMGLPAVGDLDHVAEAAESLDCHAVAVTGSDATRQSFLRQLAWSLEDVQVDLLVHPGLVDVARPRVYLQAHTGPALLHIEQPHFTGWRLRVKRLMDIVLTSIGLLIIAPLLALLAIMIKIDDPKGPVIFRQARIGIGGRPFTMYKFRTMCTDAEQRLAALAAQNQGAGPLFKLQHDPRVTRIGRTLRRFSLDELPQLINVLTGSMSLVGPRPPLQSEVETYTDQIRRRLKVTPGLTGLWQVSGRSLLSWEESVRLDLWYVENWSMLLDLGILTKTAYAVLVKRGAF